MSDAALLLVGLPPLLLAPLLDAVCMGERGLGLEKGSERVRAW